jgi:transposase
LHLLKLSFEEEKMVGGRLDTMDIRELILHIRVTASNRAVARATGFDRRTVQRYRTWVSQHGLLTGALPPLEQLHHLLEQTLPLNKPPQLISSVEPYRALVEQLYQQEVDGTAIWHRLKERGYQGALSSVYRFLRHLDPPHNGSHPTVRVERGVGEEAQVDFGYVGFMLDPTTGVPRKTWAFVMTLSYSRHQYVEFVFDQSLPSWLLLHRHALEFFGGVPGRIVTDNLKSAVTKAYWDGNDPQVQASYRECAEHYGFLISPCRPRTPQHKELVSYCTSIRCFKHKLFSSRFMRPFRWQAPFRSVIEPLVFVVGLFSL